MAPLISIIIPIYKVEQFISGCLDSIICQDNTDDFFEVVCVDDGSPDKSGEIADYYANKYKFVKVIHKLNGGLSSARNTGIKNATGRYVWFVDSDDWIDKNALSEIRNVILNEKPEAIAIESDIRYNNGILKPKFRFKEKVKNINSGIEMLCHRDFSGCAPFTIYSLNFLKNNNLNFYEGIYHEDTEFTPRAYYKLKKIYRLSGPKYYIRINPNSITRSYNEKKNFDILKVIDSLTKFSTENVELSHRHIFSQLIAQAFNSSFKSTHKMPQTTFKLFENSINKNNLKHFLFSRNIKYILEYFILRINLNLSIKFISKH